MKVIEETFSGNYKRKRAEEARCEKHSNFEEVRGQVLKYNKGYAILTT